MRKLESVRTSKMETAVFHNWISEVTYHHFYHTSFFRSESLNLAYIWKRGDYKSVWIPDGEDHGGGSIFKPPIITVISLWWLYREVGSLFSLIFCLPTIFLGNDFFLFLSLGGSKSLTTPIHPSFCGRHSGALAWPVRILQILGHSGWFKHGPFGISFQEQIWVLGENGFPKIAGAVEHWKLQFLPSPILIYRLPLLHVQIFLEWNHTEKNRAERWKMSELHQVLMTSPASLYTQLHLKPGLHFFFFFF